MVKARKSKAPLSQGFDNKISDLIYLMLDEKSLEKRRANAAEKARREEEELADEEETAEDDFSDIFLARDLSFGEVLAFVQSKDLSLQRVKKVVLEKTVDKVLKQAIEEEEEQFAAYFANETSKDDQMNLDSESLSQQNLMVTPTSNDMNKSITSIWATTKSEENKEDGDKKLSSKKRAKETGSKPKRQKTQEDRSPPSSNLSSLGGMDDVVAQLMELIGLPILHPEIFASTGVEPPRGVLLHGPPGCGKTSIANALAGELQVPFISISAPSVVSGMSGESEKKIRDLFEEAKSLAPCLVFFDEIDAITPKRDGGAQREMERRIVAQLLTSMDELSFEKTGGKPVIIIGATNRPDSLDAALRRAGRFDREICLNVPNEISRLHILKKMSSTLKIDGSIDFLKLAKLTPGFVGADLKALSTAAGTCAIKRIFQSYASLAPTSMEVDDETLTSDGSQEPKNTVNMIDPLPLSTVQKFIQSFPEPLTEEQLASLSIRYEDFLKALPTIQPTAKREGFATVPDVSWANIGALNRVRIELNMAIVQPIKRPELYEKVGISAPAGVLLWGPPGCGKTLLAKAVANESRANFISIKGPELLNKYVGESERAIRQVFSRARASVPCVIFFDELDALVPRRDASLSESSSRVVNTLLTELDGLNDRRGIFVIGATNRPDMIDAAMLRPGRLDKTLFIELPNFEEKLDIIKTLARTNGTPLSSDVDFEAIIRDESCRNFSGADLAALIRESSVLALKRSFFRTEEVHSITENNLEKEFGELNTSSEDVIVTMQDFSNALKKVKPSVSDKDRQKYERLNKKMGWVDEADGS
ncbi:putative AAA family ATPase RIX7 [Lachancea thermotolerans CBS 6340]|uniref:KLTH0E06006p n=1 Tax=Lachancea thermotolerans (strain ATCC 56472 / CBS 6340 / NRRL Y-8284) TaxID=559295 RepID=C5DHP5_LACTC|nr:KLTH0E06006p [Lachancea thermotolerans CBS 6340]CAR23306.1 KLTH0E06006p [Lachancea thermotolerans CBS 6340]